MGRDVGTTDTCVITSPLIVELADAYPRTRTARAGGVRKKQMCHEIQGKKEYDQGGSSNSNDYSSVMRDRETIQWLK